MAYFNHDWNMTMTMMMNDDDVNTIQNNVCHVIKYLLT